MIEQVGGAPAATHVAISPSRSRKRGNNEGSIVKRSDGRWMARVTLDDGKRKNIYAKTRQEAARLLTEVMRDRNTGLPIVGERQTVGTYLRKSRSVM